MSLGYILERLNKKRRCDWEGQLHELSWDKEAWNDKNRKQAPGANRGPTARTVFSSEQTARVPIKQVSELFQHRPAARIQKINNKTSPKGSENRFYSLVFLQSSKYKITKVPLSLAIKTKSFWMEPLLSEFSWLPVSHFPSTWSQIL